MSLSPLHFATSANASARAFTADTLTCDQREGLSTIRPSKTQSGARTEQPPHPRNITAEHQQSEGIQPERDITITIAPPFSPSEHRVNGEPDQSGSAPMQTTGKPEDLRRLLGIPVFQPRDQQSTYTGSRDYNYEKKYPQDKPGEENEPDARFFKVYLDEAEIFDQEKIRSHRDSLDALLVFAALFSAVVTTFVVQTSQALRPDQSLIMNYLLLQQIEIIKVMGNATAIAGIAASQYLPSTTTHSNSDVLVNGFFFASLALSLSTALLSVLAKQWLQAYDSTTSGSARDRALVRHLRFMGLTKWKFDEIIGALPLVLHTSVAVFLIGLALFLWTLHQSLACIIIVISGSSFALYLASIVLPAIDIECPYRIPLLYRPMLGLLHFSSGCYRKLQLVRIWLCPTFISRNPDGQLPSNGTLSTTPPLSLKDAERSYVQDADGALRYLHHSIAWLHEVSSNMSVQRVAAQAIAGRSCQYALQISSASLGAVCTPGLIQITTAGLFDMEDVAPSFSIWVRVMEHLKLACYLSSATPPEEELMRTITKAVDLGRVNHIQYILDYSHYKDINMKQPNNYQGVDETPLYAAVRNRNHAVIRLLLNHGASPALHGGNDGSPIRVAVLECDRDLIELLLENWPVNHNDLSDYLPILQEAIKAGRLEVVKLLLKKGADKNMEGGLYDSALQAAFTQGHSDIAKLLLEKRADTNFEDGAYRYGSLLQAASNRNDLDIVKQLSKDAEVTLEGWDYGSVLQAASAGDHLEIVKLLLENGADVDLAGGFYELRLQAAFTQGHFHLVKLFVEKGAYTNLEGGEYWNGLLLQVASSRGNLDIVQQLLAKRATVNFEGGFYGSALQVACTGGHLETVRLLMMKEADVNLEGGVYGSPLQAASAGGHLEIVQLLFAKEPRVNFQGGKYGSALQAASSGGYLKVVKLLLEKGADVNLGMGVYGSPLQVASTEGHLEIVELLLEKEADVNLEGGKYGSALQAASAMGHVEIVKLLLAKGADVNLRGGEYGSAFKAASSWGHLEVMDLLMEQGADI